MIRWLKASSDVVLQDADEAAANRYGDHRGDENLLSRPSLPRTRNVDDADDLRGGMAPSLATAMRHEGEERGHQ
jgi:hypothetical protein